MARGVQDIPAHRIPAQWDPKWFAKWIREVLVNVDIRNAIEGPGIQITGQPDTPATLTASADVLALINQPYVLATSSAFLPNERILAGQSGIVSVTDGGAGANITVGLELGGITPIYLEQEPGWSVMGRVPNATGYLQPITAALDGDVLRVAGDFLGFGDIVLRASNFANPSATVGLAAVNGSAITAMRSDGAPALDVSISPTWSGTHTFSITPVVPNDSWTYAKIQNVSATSRFLGRITSGAGDIEELTGTQATTLLDAFTSALKGLAPASGGGTANFLRADGSWAAPGGAAGANPSASVGLAAVNGSASTFLRSDGAPALSQAISPTWTAQHHFQGPPSAYLTANAITIGAGSLGGRFLFTASAAAANAKMWDFVTNNTQFFIRTIDDADVSTRSLLAATRSGLALTAVDYANSTDAPPHRFFGHIKIAGSVSPDNATNGVQMGSASSGGKLYFSSSGGGSNSKLWDFVTSTTQFFIRTLNDADTDSRTVLGATRSGYAVTAIAYGNATDNPPHTFNGQLVPNNQSLSTGASVPAIGANKPGSAVSLTPSTWWGIVVNGTQYYIPLWI